MTDASATQGREAVAWLRRPLRVALPGAADGGGLHVMVPASGIQRSASVLGRVIPVAMVVVGATVAIVAAVLEGTDHHGLAALGVEAGAAVWFGGAVTLGATRAPDVLRGVLLALAAVGGAAVISLALALDWSGAGLTLAMEFGVGAIAVAAIDVVLLGLLYPRLGEVADLDPSSVVTIGLRRSQAVVEVDRPR